MKKIIAITAAFLLCVTALTACKPKTDVKDVPETEPAIVTESTASTTTAAPETTTTEATTTTAAETEPAAQGASASYASLEEFAAAKPFKTLTGEKSSNEDSKFKKFTEDLAKDEKLYMDMAAIDNSLSMVMAFEMPLSLYVNISGVMPESGSEKVDMTIMLTNSTMYILDGSTKTGMYFAAPEGEDGLDGLGLTDSFSGILDIKDEDAGSFSTCVVEIDGKDYTFEFSDDIGFLFDGDKPYAIIGEENDSLPTNAFIINELSTNVPSGLLDVPTGYELTDMSSLFSED